MKKIISIFMICTLMCTVLGCSNNKSASKGNIKVFASVSSSEDQFIAKIMDGMKDCADKDNVELEIQSANKNVETQVDQVKSAKDDGYNAIACILVDADTAQQIINAAGDIPVIFINVQPDDSKLRANKDIYIAADEQQVSDKTSKYLEEYFSNKKSFDAVMFEGDRNSKAASIRSDKLEYELKEDGYDINYVFQDEAMWSREKAKEMFKVFLKLNKNYDCIICNNDDMALGVIDAMKEEGIDPSSVPILGVDALEEACSEIKIGNMAFTLKQSGEQQGESAIKAAQKLGKGEKITDLEYADKEGKYIWHPFIEVDKSNVSEYMNK